MHSAMPLNKLVYNVHKAKFVVIKKSLVDDVHEEEQSALEDQQEKILCGLLKKINANKKKNQNDHPPSVVVSTPPSMATVREPSQHHQRMSSPTNGVIPQILAPTPSKIQVFDATSKVSEFLSMVYRWLNQETSISDDTWRAAIIMQSFIQASMKNNEGLDLVLSICKILNIDGNECLRWCQNRKKEIVDDGKGNGRDQMTDLMETFVLDIHSMKLPSYIDEFIHTEEDVFVYAYHNGQQTYASSKTWDDHFRDAKGLNEDSQSVASLSTFLDTVANSVICPIDQRDFLARGADLIVRGKSSREERTCILLCLSKKDPNPQPGLLSLRLWSDTGTDSFIFALKIKILPKSKYVQNTLNINRQIKRSKELSLGLGVGSVGNGGTSTGVTNELIESTQKLVDRKKWDSKWRAERDLLTKEQLIAAMLPLDEVLELDELDIEAVAEYLHG
eukprot:CAMPEP_0114335136 /NCGR_PEP_ID=MMETSP0101-20121206/4855_1 /TAXON_ID=38822 ORGANISM="Pteridomonas danica, Strain PT" /NCGR_SAMPLE_ID=MMETSP0101 /ASSEMBLY_ACC=CAM_ASM_000211 /LENGTH=446 /DNA_ID=CAMNT_0001466657 /DNA_START=68 /DNA_END=1408 /DNA_ORIENTATION=+